MCTPRQAGNTYWGDRFAFKIRLIGFLLMALMVAHNVITALLRGGN